MPLIRSQPAKKTRSSRSTAPRNSARQRQVELAGPPMPLPPTSTTDHEMFSWLGWFYRFHAEPPRCIPVVLKTVDCPVFNKDGSPALDGHGQPTTMRCVREVAHTLLDRHAPWSMITWKVGLPGVQFEERATLAEAMALFEQAPEPVHLLR